MSDNRRRSFRCPNTGEKIAFLSSGEKEIQVDLLDESADGFAISGKGLPPKNTDELRLRTAGGWSQVAICREDQEDGTVILGLKRVAELPDPRDTKKAAASSVVFFSQGVANPGQQISVTGTILMSALAVVLGFWAVLFGIAWFK